MASILMTRLCCSPKIRASTIRKLRIGRSIRRYSKDSEKDDALEEARKQTLKEKAMGPATETPFNIGKGALAGAAAVGLGALCFYGLGQSQQSTILQQKHLWPHYVRERVKTTYKYFFGSLVITAGSAMAAFRSEPILRLVANNGYVGMAICLAAILGTGMLAQGIDYKEGFGPKQMAWMLHSSVMGVMLAPLIFLGGPVLVRAAWYTAGVVGGLSAIAICAPSERFLMMSGPLAMGLGVVFVSSIANIFISPATALGAGLYSISLYGGLIVFSGFLLYDTQRIVKEAEEYPLITPAMFGMRPYDPINAAIAIYMDTLNIFIRIAVILGGGGGGQKR